MTFPRSPRLARAALATCAVLGILGATEGSWTDPAAATAADPDFAIQGEYRADGAGVQVAALGKGRFLYVELPGGLPGAGWPGKPFTATVLDGAAVGERLAKGKLTRSGRTSPTMGAKPPAGAVVLFTEGADQGKVDAAWDKARLDGGLLCQGTKTRRTFRDFRLHLEFRLAYKPGALPSSQDRGNSGLYIFHRYEVQIIDTFGLHHGSLWEGADGGKAWSEAFKRDLGVGPGSKATQWCGAMYVTRVPDINAALPPLEWQTYDVVFRAPRLDGATKTADARISVRHNGIPIHTDVALAKGTGAGGSKQEVAEEALYLQEHGNQVRFRNIWVVEEK